MAMVQHVGVEEGTSPRKPESEESQLLCSGTSTDPQKVLPEGCALTQSVFQKFFLRVLYRGSGAQGEGSREEGMI